MEEVIPYNTYLSGRVVTRHPLSADCTGCENAQFHSTLNLWAAFCAQNTCVKQECRVFSKKHSEGHIGHLFFIDCLFPLSFISTHYWELFESEDCTDSNNSLCTLCACTCQKIGYFDLRYFVWNRASEDYFDQILSNIRKLFKFYHDLQSNFII